MKKTFIAATIALAATTAMAGDFERISRNETNDGDYFLALKQVKKISGGYKIGVIQNFDTPKKYDGLFVPVETTYFTYNLPCTGKSALITGGAMADKDGKILIEKTMNEPMSFSSGSAMGLVQTYLCKGNKS